jgi:hypothetical protein
MHSCGLFPTFFGEPKDQIGKNPKKQ